MTHERHILLALGSYQHHTHRGVARFAKAHGWHLSADMAYGGSIPDNWYGDGILTSLNTEPDDDLTRFIRDACKRGIPVVALNLNQPDLNLPRVVGDHAAMGRLAAEHLIARGYTELAFYRLHDTPTARLRLEGFRQAAGQRPIHRMAPNPRLPWHQLRAQTLQQLKKLPKPLGVFAYNDYQASQVLDAARHGSLLVPENIAVLGVDNDGLVCESVAVSLSSVQHDLEAVGWQGAELLQNIMDGQAPPSQPLVIAPQGLIARRSTDTFAFTNPAVVSALSWLHRHYTQRISVNDVVKQTSVSRRTLEIAFRDQVGRSIHEELLRLRLSLVQELLKHTDKSLSDIAEQSGLGSAQYLSQAFRRKFGATPRTWQRIQTG